MLVLSSALKQKIIS